jgi:E3 ubiquitin-protein ligase SHPRH
MIARNECQEAQRIVVVACNALAGIVLLQGGARNVAEAVSIYRSTLNLAEKNKTLFAMDRIQLLHILKNLRDALDMAKVGLRDPSTSKTDFDIFGSLGITPREKNIANEIERMRDAYMAEGRARLSAAMAKFQDARQEVDRLTAAGGDGSIDNGKWWPDALVLVMEFGDPEAFIDRLVRELLDVLPTINTGIKTLAHQLQSFSSIVPVLTVAVDETSMARHVLLKRMDTLPGAIRPTRAQIAKSGQCRGCREFGAQGAPCEHCEAEPILEAYERSLFSFIGQRKPRKGSVNSENVGQLECDVNDDDDESNSRDGGAATRDVELQVQAARASGMSARDVAAVKKSMSIALRPKRKPQVGLAFSAPVQSEVERIMHILATIVRSKGDVGMRSSMEQWFKTLEAHKKEYSAGKEAFHAQRDMLGELDELDQAMQRMALFDSSTSFANLSVHQQQFTIAQVMLPSLRTQFGIDKELGMANLDAKRGEVIYLMSLEQSGDKGDAACIDSSSDASKVRQSCPICLMEMDANVAFFSCGHSFCSECVTVLIRRATSNFTKRVQCPSCRRMSAIDGISFASCTASARQAKGKFDVGEGSASSCRDEKNEFGTDGNPEKSKMSASLELALGAGIESDDVAAHVTSTPYLFPGEVQSHWDDKQIVIHGSHGAKISAVVRVLKAITVNDPGAKALVFSQWLEVLSILGNALSENGVSYGSMMGLNFGVSKRSNSPATILADFKRSTTRNVLLLPLRKGAAGLNIVEATHVLLVEPSLNPSAELQAVSRVHRLSQTKPTYVHRFIVNNTIEDKVRKIAQGRTGTENSPMSSETVTDKEVIEIFDDDGQ